MSVGLLGQLDDVAALPKVAAASLDDVAGMAMKAGFKASGAVIDDAAVSPTRLRRSRGKVVLSDQGGPGASTRSGQSL